MQTATQALHLRGGGMYQGCGGMHSVLHSAGMGTQEGQVEREAVASLDHDYRLPQPPLPFAGLPLPVEELVRAIVAPALPVSGAPATRPVEVM